VNSRRLLPRIFLAWLIADVACLALGVRWNWFLGMGVRGLLIDFLLGVIVFGQYLQENGKL